MKRFFALLLSLALAFSLAACESEGNGGTWADRQELNYLYSGELTTINYLWSSSESEYGYAANLVDGLVQYDKYGVVGPGLATEWENSEDGLTWTFKIRDDVYWVDHKGEQVAQVTAQDWVDGMKWILTYENASRNAGNIYNYIKNARAFYNNGNTDYDGDEKTGDFEEVGVKAIDKLTLQYTLIDPCPFFISLLSYVSYYPVYGEFIDAQGERFGTDNENFLYNGAFILETWEHQNVRTLVKNESYWDKDNIYINKINAVYNAEASTLSPEMFMRGEVTSCDIATAVLDEWIKDPLRAKIIRPASPSYYSYFYCFNFDPQFDAEYEPENWLLAVNNKNFRLSIVYAFDRVAAVTTSDPYTPELNIMNTITPVDFASNSKGTDFTNIGPLKELTEEGLDRYNLEKALQFKEAAIDELTAEGAAFPIKILMPYNTSGTSWTERVQVIKQQLERELGKDYIEIIIDPNPPTNFLQNVRRSGKYALMECNDGPMYADPEAYTAWSVETAASVYNKPHFAYGYDDPNGKKHYTNLLDAAKAERLDVDKRYELFAEAEAFLINEAFVIPYVRSVPSYVGSYLNPLEAPFSPFGVSVLTYKYQKVLEAPIDADTWTSLLSNWRVAREKALAEADQQ